MLSDENLLLAVRDLAESGQKLPALLLLSHVSQPAPIIAVRNKGVAIGFRVVTQWNLSAILRGAATDGFVAQLTTGWKLLKPSEDALSSHYRPEAPLISETRHALKEYVAAIAHVDRRRFIEEAVRCFDAKAYRAAIVLSWVGAAHIIQEYIVGSHLAAFNSAGSRRPKFFPVRVVKDFGVVGEANMLQLCQDAGIFDKAEKQELQARLDLRNRCGHPNSVHVAEQVVAAHIESLLLNVYAKY